MISGIVFLTGFSPSLDTMTTIAISNCFEEQWLYLFTSTMLGWITAFFVTQMVYVFALWFFLALYTIKPLYDSIWDGRYLVTIIFIVSVIIGLGIGIEVLGTIIQAV